MKTRLITVVLLLISQVVSAQTSLSYLNNSLLSGDSNIYKDIQFMEPGNAGPNQIWDFSKIQFTGKNPVSTIQAAAEPKMTGVGDYNLSLLDNGYDYFMKSSESQLEELGYVNTDLKLVLKYSDPVIKMKYPFSFGQQYADHFIGVALFNETSTIDFFGDCAVSADGYGTLILPDQTISGALRVKTIKKGLQINMCGTTDVNILKYSWYASGFRYPVLNVSIVENTPSTGAPTIIKTANTNTSQVSMRSSPIVTNASASSTTTVVLPEKTAVNVVVSPNPFTDKMTYGYLLKEPLNVSIELYDLSGKNKGWIIKNQSQTAGSYSEEITALNYALTSGVYFLKFTFDKQVVICKVVKL